MDMLDIHLTFVSVKGSRENRYTLETVEQQYETAYDEMLKSVTQCEESWQSDRSSSIF